MPGPEVCLAFSKCCWGLIQTVGFCFSLKSDSQSFVLKGNYSNGPHVYENGLLLGIQHRDHSCMSHLLTSEWSFQKDLTVDVTDSVVCESGALHCPAVIVVLQKNLSVPPSLCGIWPLCLLLYITHTESISAFLVFTTTNKTSKT